jgi:adenosine deaminase
VSEATYTFDSFEGFFEIYRAIQHVLSTPDAWARLAYESVLDAAASGVVYREAFFTPAKQLRDGQVLTDVLAALHEGLSAGEADTGTHTALIADIDREYGPVAGRELVEQVCAARRAGAAGSERVLGIGMSAVELGTDPKDYAAAFALAGRDGLRRTAHQGAEGPAQNIADALEVLGCERIDHGLASLDDDELLARLRGERTPLTVCPSSNLSVGRYASLAEHPFPHMRRAGLLVSLNSDDPAMTGIPLDIEYEVIADAYGWSPAEMLRIALDGIEASWLDDDAKRRLAARTEAAATEAAVRGSAEG